MSAEPETARVSFSVSFPDGSTFDVSVLATDTLRQLREQVSVRHPVPPACYLKICQNAQVLADEVPITRLDSAQPLFCIIARETQVEALLQAAGSWSGYYELLAGAVCDPNESTIRVLGPMPSILSVLEDLGGQAPDMKGLRVQDGSLEYVGQKGDLLLPSLDAMPLLAAAGAERFKHVTFRVEVNADVYNRGLGVVLEASPLLVPTLDQNKIPKFIYNGYGLSDDRARNVVKFHPGMQGGALRVEGCGGKGNHNIGFMPANWSSSGHRFHTLEIAVGADGNNRVSIEGTEPGQKWTGVEWTHQLTAGSHIPALYAWVDRLNNESDPMQIGTISLRVHM